MGQWAVSKYARGFAVTKGENGRVPQLYYADDGSFITESTADLQAIFDLNWYLMKMSGMAVKVKGKEKTAYMAVRYENGIARNIEGAPMRLLDGTEIPQIRAPRSIKRATSTARGQTSKGEPRKGSKFKWKEAPRAATLAATQPVVLEFYDSSTSW